MKKVEDYRAHADECRSMATRVGSPANQVMLMNMAATWESLAVNRQAQIARRQRAGRTFGDGHGRLRRMPAFLVGSLERSLSGFADVPVMC
jgi:hypothetical protein